MKKLALGMVALASTAIASSPAQAAIVLVGQYEGNDCGGKDNPPFPTCWATQTGIVLGPVEGGSPTVYKLGSDDEETFNALFPTIDGSEFDVSLGSNTLSFTYTPGEGDPNLHYFTVKQANGYVLFYDSDPILSGSVNLGTYFEQPGFSHITFFNTGTTGVPEPATWAMLLIGFGAIGATLRTKKKSLTGRRLRIA